MFYSKTTSQYASFMQCELVLVKLNVIVIISSCYLSGKAVWAMSQRYPSEAAINIYIQMFFE